MPFLLLFFVTCVKQFLKLKFVLEPNKNAKMDGMLIKKSVKIPLIAPTLGGGCPPVIYILGDMACHKIIII